MTEFLFLRIQIFLIGFIRSGISSGTRRVTLSPYPFDADDLPRIVRHEANRGKSEVD